MSYTDQAEIVPGPSGAGPSTRFNFPDDVLKRLPPKGAHKLRELRQAREDQRVLVLAASDACRDAREAKMRAQSDLRMATMPRANGGRGLLPGSDEEVRLRTLIAEHGDELTRHNELMLLRSGQLEFQSHLLDALDGFVRDLPADSSISDHTAPTIKAGVDLHDAVEKARHRIRQLRADLDEVRAAPFPSSVVKKAIASQVAALARRGAPNVLDVVEGGGELRFPTLVARNRIEGGRGLAAVEVPDAFGLMAWAFGDLLIARLNAEIDAIADDSAALSDTQRAERQKVIQSDLLSVEREEEGLITLAAQRGLQIDRRTDADPRAVLGVTIA